MLCLNPAILQTNILEPLHAVFFINGREGFVSGSKGGIYKTTDSAINWTLLNSGVDLPVRSLYFIDAQKGFAVGGQNSCTGTGCVPQGGFILKTTDAGNTWVKVYTPTNRREITSVYFLDAKTGFCVGDDVIMKTVDGGENWSEYRIANQALKMMKVKFSSNQNGLIACLNDKVVKTIDQGVTWQIISTNLDRGYYDISEANGSTYLSGQGKVTKSINEGTSWIDLPNSPADIYAIHFIDSQNGFAFGRGKYSGGDFGYSAGSIYCTSNGGATWNGTAEIKETELIQSVSFPTSKIGYAVSGTKLIRVFVK